MEKIKEALKKAKSQTNVSQNKVSQVKNKSPTNDLLKNDISESSIFYAQTKIIKFDAQTLENNRIVALNKHSPASWAFDSLRTQVLQKMEENGWSTLAIVSPTPEAGKSVIAINLAISIAHKPNKTVMLVDFDLRKPRIAKYLGIKCKKSINDFISGDAELKDIIVNPGIPKLTILPTNNSVARSAETLSSSKIQDLVSELKDRYSSRIIIFDLPPLLNVDDAMVLLPQVDCVLFVVGDGQHSETEIIESMRLLSRSNILGVVVNRAEVEERNYY
jgi:capsular exopolysaccharide synthesis family protein